MGLFDDQHLKRETTWSWSEPDVSVKGRSFTLLVNPFAENVA